MSEEAKISFEEFKRLDLRVARIVEVREHPNADKLTIITVDVGGRTKQIVAGIRGHYDNADLVGRNIVLVNNLEPAKLRGETSEGMLLAAVDGECVVLVAPEKDMPPGTPVS